MQNFPSPTPAEMQVRFEEIEKSKENIQLTTSGHNPSQLSSLLNKDPSKRQSEQIYMKAKFEQRLAEAGIASPDRLLVYYEYVLWMVQHCPEGTLKSKEIIPLLERCTREYFNNKEYINNRKYVKLWLLLVAYSPSDDRNALFNHMKINSIGSKLDIFYSEYAKFQEMIRGNPQEAQDIYLLGIESEAHPIEELKKKYEAFKSRNPNIASKPSGPVAQNVIVRETKPAFPVFFDQNENCREIENVANAIGVQFPLEAERKKENFPVAERQWTSLPPTSSNLNIPHSKPEIFKDVRAFEQKASYKSELFIRGCSVLSFEQWRLATLLAKIPLSKMTRRSPIVKNGAKNISTNEVVLDRASKQSAANVSSRSNSNVAHIVPLQANVVDCAAKKLGTSIASPTINTKYALNNLIPMFSENLAPSEEDSFCESGEPPKNTKPIENFAVYRDNDTLQGNPFLTLHSKTPQTPAMTTIEETEKSTLRTDRKISDVDFASKQEERVVVNFDLNIRETNEAKEPIVLNEFDSELRVAASDLNSESRVAASDLNSESRVAANDLNSEIVPSLPQSTPIVLKRSIARIYSPSPITPADKDDQSFSFSHSPTFVSPIAEREYSKIHCFTSSYQKEHLKNIAVQYEKDLSSTALTFDSLIGSKLTLADENSYEIVQCIGEGGFAKIFKCNVSNSKRALDCQCRPNQAEKVELDAKNASDTAFDIAQHSEVALKIQVPPFEWEFHILQRIHSKLIYCRDLFVKPLGYFCYSNCSVLALELGTFGNLLDCTNSYLQRNESINEFVVLYILIELLKALNELHSIGIIHGDLKCENILVSEDSDLPPIKLADFGRSIETSLDNLQEGRYFCTPNDLEDDDCFQQIYNDKPFTFEVDYVGIASVAHVLLFQDYIELAQTENRLTIKHKLKRYWNVEFWTFFFDFFLNAKCPSGTPLVKHVEQMIGKMQKLLAKCNNFQLIYNKHTWNLLIHKQKTLI